MTYDRPQRALAWAEEMFGPVALEPRERISRFVEEALELAHAMDLDHVTVQAIIKRVWSRDRGYIPARSGRLT